MRDRMLGHVRAIALCGLLLVTYTIAMTLVSCATASTGTVGTAAYLDLVCQLDEPRILSKGVPLIVGLNRIALPGIIGLIMIGVSGGLALLFSLLLPKKVKPAELTKFDWAGRGNRQRSGERGSHGGDH